MGFTITREKAAEDLGISTRTIDRYIKRGKLSYKKVANKVLLETAQVYALKNEFDLLHQEPQEAVVIHERGDAISIQDGPSKLDAIIDKKIEKFFTVFNEKEKIIHEKDKMIFVLQQRVGELEQKVKTMIALPDYSKERQVVLVEKQKLEDVIKSLQKDVKNEKTKNVVYLGLLLIIVFVILFIMFQVTG